MTRSEIAFQECTANPIFLFQRKGLRGVWETERVFENREEADGYGKARSYNYPKGWRVFCVPAEGKLADLLRGASG